MLRRNGILDADALAKQGFTLRHARIPRDRMDLRRRLTTLVAAGLAGLAIGCSAPSNGPAGVAAKGSDDEDIAAARRDCAAVTDAERERCVDTQLRRSRGSRNTY